MKKTFIAFLGGVAIVLLVVLAIMVQKNPALAQSGGFSGGVSVVVNTISANQLSANGQAYGPGDNLGCNPQPLSSGYYYIDSQNSWTAPFDLTQTVQGSSGCSNNNTAYQYTFTFTDTTHIASLTPGAHELYACVSASGGSVSSPSGR